MKTFTCPPLCGVATDSSNRTVEWGLVEYVQDFLLPSALDTPDHCEAALRVIRSLPPRGAEQVGKPVHLEGSDWELLCKLCRQVQPRGAENIVAVGTCNIVIMRAVDAPVSKPSEPSSGT